MKRGASKRLRATQPIVSVYEEGLVDRRKDTPQVVQYEQIKTVYLMAVVINGVLNYVIAPCKRDKKSRSMNR